MPDNNQIDEYAAQSAFIFTGKPIQNNASTLEGISAENTVIFQVVSVLRAPAMFSSMAGQQVTVRFKEKPSLNIGNAVTVFANGWLFGESIAVDAVGIIPETDITVLNTALQKSGESQHDQALKERIDSAELGVVGKVISVKKSPMQYPHMSEHDPVWQEATIQVDSVLKGQNNTKNVKVLFPASDDIRWHKVHKYAEGQQGIWMVQNGNRQNTKGISSKVLAAIPTGDVFTTVHPMDYQPLDALNKVKSLL